MKLLGNFKIAIVRALCGKYDKVQKEKNKQENLGAPEILVHEVRKFASLCAHPDQAQGDPSSASSSTSGSSTFAVQYDADGLVQGLGRTTLLNKGFTVGQSVVDKRSEDGSLWNIKEIDGNGTTTLTYIAPDGKIQENRWEKVDLATFVATYKEVKKIQLLPGYPHSDACFHKDIGDVDRKCRVFSVLRQCLIHFACPDARIQIQPVKCVLADRDYDIGDYCVAPAVSNLAQIVVDRNRSVNFTISWVSCILASWRSFFPGLAEPLTPGFGPQATEAPWQIIATLQNRPNTRRPGLANWPFPGGGGAGGPPKEARCVQDTTNQDIRRFTKEIWQPQFFQICRVQLLGAYEYEIHNFPAGGQLLAHGGKPNGGDTTKAKSSIIEGNQESSPKEPSKFERGRAKSSNVERTREFTTPGRLPSTKKIIFFSHPPIGPPPFASNSGGQRKASIPVLGHEQGQ